MEYVIGFIIGAIVGFVAGFLVFRNNQKRINELEAKLENQSKEIAEKVEAAVKDIKDITKK